MKKTFLGLFTAFFLLAAAYAFAKFQGDFVSWFLFYAFSPIVIYMLVQHVLAFKGLKVDRVLDKHTCTAGETLMGRITIMNPLRIPYVYVFIKDRIPERMTAEINGTEDMHYPWFQKEYSFQYSLPNLHRGIFKWDQIEMQTGDLFGFIKKNMTYIQPERVVVYPKHQDIRLWPTYNDKNAGITHKSNRRQFEDVSSVMGVRDYVSGDKLSRIHWKASAKASGLKTKEFEHQVSNDFMFFLDRQERVYGSNNHPLFEKAISLTASLARYAFKHHFSAGLVSCGHERTVLTMSKEQQQLFRIFDHLAGVNADATTPFTTTIMQEMVYVPVGTTVVIVSPQLDEKIVRVLADIVFRKIKVEFFWIKNQQMTSLKKKCLNMLDQEQITYCVVEGDNFNQILVGGGNYATV